MRRTITILLLLLLYLCDVHKGTPYGPDGDPPWPTATNVKLIRRLALKTERAGWPGDWDHHPGRIIPSIKTSRAYSKALHRGRLSPYLYTTHNESEARSAEAVGLGCRARSQGACPVSLAYPCFPCVPLSPIEKDYYPPGSRPRSRFSYP